MLLFHHGLAGGQWYRFVQNCLSQGSTICKLVPALMVPGSLECAVPYIQKLVDFSTYTLNIWRANPTKTFWLRPIGFAGNLISSLKVINTVASLAREFVWLYVRISLWRTIPILGRGWEASNSYLAKYKNGLDDVVKAASKTGAIFTRGFMREYVKQYTHFLILSVSCEKFLKTTSTTAH